LLPDSYTISFIAGDIVEGLVIGEGGWRVCETHWNVWHANLQLCGESLVDIYINLFAA